MFAFMANKTRLYVDHPLGQGQSVPLAKEQAHYLFGVMRKRDGDTISLINSRDGEWDAAVVQAGKKAGTLICVAQTAPLQMPPDVWLVFAPIRKERTAFIVEKAVELGAARIVPMQTEFTNNADRLRVDKLRAHALEATEQCGGTYVPPVDDLQKMSKVLDGWDSNRRIMFCDETKIGQASTLAKDMTGSWAIFIGPEGGFSSAEADRLRAMDCAVAVSLGPRILRADTAAVAALTMWQQSLGDW